jgi:endonuclease/exonuclease/phosphatase family metal-dependent hydrolase
MSLNVRYDNTSDGEDRWDLRKEELCQLVTRVKPDFLGIQEALPRQVEYMDQQLKEHSFLGFGRDGQGTDSESVPLFYNTKSHELLHSEVFWMSETPEVPSKGWDAALNRITTYGVFLNKKTQDTIHVFNTHFDHRGEKARENSSHLLVSKLKSLALLDKKVILMGDFNSKPEEIPIQVISQLMSDSYLEPDKDPEGPSGTFSGFDLKATLNDRIDYIFTLNLKVLRYANLDDKRKNGRWISDHLPVFIEVEP